MRSRIFGLENDYGVLIHYADAGRAGRDHALAAANVADEIVATVSGARTPTTRHLFNGAVAYVDLGHPEYATPECSNPFELAAADRAGERLYAQATASVAERLGLRLWLLKNNLDSAGNTYDCHENYLIPRDVCYKDLVRALTPLLITRPIFAGAGSPPRAGTCDEFSLSQRAWHLNTDQPGVLGPARDLVSTRADPHADVLRWRRLHVTAGDSNLSEYVTALKVGVVALFLRCYEDGVDPSVNYHR